MHTVKNDRIVHCKYMQFILVTIYMTVKKITFFSLKMETNCEAQDWRIDPGEIFRPWFWVHFVQDTSHRDMKFCDYKI